MSEILYEDEGAGQYLGGSGKPVSTRTLARWRAQGKGPKFCRIGSLIRYRQSALDEYLNANTFQSTSEADQVADA